MIGTCKPPLPTIIIGAHHHLYSDYDEQGLRYKLYAAEILFNKGVLLLQLGRQSDGLACLGKAVLKKVLPSHHTMHETLAYPDRKYDLYKLVSDFIIRTLLAPSPPIFPGLYLFLFSLQVYSSDLQTAR